MPVDEFLAEEYGTPVLSRVAVRSAHGKAVPLRSAVRQKLFSGESLDTIPANSVRVKQAVERLRHEENAKRVFAGF